jgi:phosphoserine phosphatase
LEIDLETNTLTGRVINDIITPERKEQIVKELAEKYEIDMQHVVCVGDGANDLLMLKLAGLGIAFNAKPKVQKEVNLDNK